MILLKLFTFFSAGLVSLAANKAQTAFSGQDILNGMQVDLKIKTEKGVVVIFLSSVCPCSNSHISEIRNLKNEYPDYLFVGIHSNTEEKGESVRAYFKAAALGFSILEDADQKIADALRASKTPYAVVILQNGDIAYRGGVSDRHTFTEDSKRKYLREALSELKNGVKVSIPETRALGCPLRS